MVDLYSRVVCNQDDTYMKHGNIQSMSCDRELTQLCACDVHFFHQSNLLVKKIAKVFCTTYL